MLPWRLALLVLLVLVTGHGEAAAASSPQAAAAFPPPLSSYQAGEQGLSLLEVLRHRVSVEPLNAIATAIFFLAILHSFFAPRFLAASHHLRDKIIRERGGDGHSFWVEVLHFFGEIEAVFGIWVVPLLLMIEAMKGPRSAERFVGKVNYTEAIFVVVIMSVAATRPVLWVAEAVLGGLARLAGGSPMAWWLSILVVGPCLGSFITEPAAMVICALLLGRRVFDLSPSTRLRYATLGLLFVNISVGGTLTHFAAPPVLMVAGKFDWDFMFMLQNFGWKAVVGIVLSTTMYAALFRKDLLELKLKAVEPMTQEPRERVPAGVAVVHFAVLGLVVTFAHTPAAIIGLFLFFLAFHQATAPHQDPVDLRPPLLVGFFLAGLVIHGALQQWWIEPILGRLSALAMMEGAIILTAFNDNAAITYLASLVPGLSDEAKYAVVAGAVTGGGLTVIANAPNPAGQSALARYFPDGVAPGGLFLGALLPTAILAAAFLLLP